MAGLQQLDARLQMHGAVIGVAIESAEGLLVERLYDQGLRLFCLSPKVSARARERYRLASSKSDSFDACVLADSLRHEHRHWRSLAVPSLLLAELRALTRDRERLVWNQRDVENQLRAIVQAYHPAAPHLFSSLDRDISLAFLRDYPTPAQDARAGTGRMAAFCGRHGYSGRTRPELLVERLRPNLLSASNGTTAGKAFSAMLFVDQLGSNGERADPSTTHPISDNTLGNPRALACGQCRRCQPAQPPGQHPGGLDKGMDMFGGVPRPATAPTTGSATAEQPAASTRMLSTIPADRVGVKPKTRHN